MRDKERQGGREKIKERERERKSVRETGSEKEVEGGRG